MLGDRAVVAVDGGPIPFGTPGTVVAIKGESVDIILDYECVGGTHLQHT